MGIKEKLKTAKESDWLTKDISPQEFDQIKTDQIKSTTRERDRINDLLYIMQSVNEYIFSEIRETLSVHRLRTPNEIYDSLEFRISDRIAHMNRRENVDDLQ